MGELVLAKARGRKVKPPCPSENQSARAHAAIERAITSTDSHTRLILSALEELRDKSSPERLPYVLEGLGDACTQLHDVMTSPAFRERVGPGFPELPALTSLGSTERLAIETDGQDVQGDLSDGEVSEQAARTPADGGYPSQTNGVST